MLTAERASFDEETLSIMGMYTVAGEEYLAHDGVKGMHWGVRKVRDLIGHHPGGGAAPDPVKQKQHHEAIVKAAIATGAVLAGAILLKRAGFKMTSPASRKIMLGGAKTSLSILRGSGRIMATTTVKIAPKAGKIVGKGGYKLGKVAGKGAYTGAIAGSKAAGRAIAENGSKFYEKGIKATARSTVKLGSHAMYKFTGRGTPIVNDVAKKSVNLSPFDLLLNTRADKLGGRR